MSQGDMFLKIDGAKQGAIKGESADDAHADEIDVLSWSWGMRSEGAMGAAGPSQKSTIDFLKVDKYVDRASTALMSSMRNNELLKKAVLTCRKAGSTGAKPIDYLVVTIQEGRITNFEVNVDPKDHTKIFESVTFSFRSIEVQYKAQDATGLAKAASTFSAEIN